MRGKFTRRIANMRTNRQYYDMRSCAQSKRLLTTEYAHDMEYAYRHAPVTAGACLHSHEMKTGIVSHGSKHVDVVFKWAGSTP